MPAPLDIVRAELDRSPRDSEYLDLGNTNDWSAADRRAAAAELASAAAEGDPRAPATLVGLLPSEELRGVLESLLTTAPSAARVEAGWQLLAQLQQSIVSAIADRLRDGQLPGYAQTRAINLLIASGCDSTLRAMLDTTTHDDVWRAIVDRLWDARALWRFPSPAWAGLGLVKWQLSLPFLSFRRPLLATLSSLLDGVAPETLGFAPIAAGPMPEALSAAFADVDSGRGPIPEAILAPLDEERRRALLVYAAEDAARGRNVRALVYVAQLGGSAHDDVLRWASEEGVVAFAQAARELLQTRL